MIRITISAVVLSIATPLAGVMAETLAPTTMFEGVVPAAANNRTAQPGQVSVQSWELGGPKGVAHEIPLHGFYVAHLLSGSISTTIDGETAKPAPGAYWTIKTGATMQVKVLGEFAVLETIVVAKQ